MKKTELAYMAGIFDGEGAIWITKRHIKQKGTYNFMLEVAIGMANPYIPELFQCTFGGSFLIAREATEKRQTIWRWQLRAKQTLPFLQVILPYLRLKRSEAELAINFQLNKHHGASEGEWGNRLRTEKELALEETQRILMKKLKVKSTHE